MGAGRSPVGWCYEKVADCGGNQARRRLRQDDPRLGCGNDILDAVDIRDNDGGAAGDAFQQHVGPALRARYQQQQIGRGVNFRKAVLRHAAEEANVVGEPKRLGQRRDRGALRPLAHYDQIALRQSGQCLDHQPMALQADQIANREKGWPGKAERNSRRLAVGRPKKREIHPVAEHTHAFLGDPETHQPSLQTTRYRDQPVGMPDGPADPSPWDGEFRNDIESFVSREVVEASIVKGRYELWPQPGIQYWGFIDPSGGSGRDSMALAIAHREGSQGLLDEVRVLDAIREWRPEFSPDQVTAEAASTLNHYGISTIRGDKFGGQWVAERFRQYGISYEPTELVKSEIYQEFLPLLNGQGARLLDHERLLMQLCQLESRTVRGSGRPVIDHVTGAHDDLANVAAGALIGAGMTRSQLAWTGML